MALDCIHPNKIVSSRLEAIYALHTKKMDFRLDEGPYIDLLENLGNPHLNLPPVIHVAGTNGKGSTIAFIKSILEASGKKVHIYTSPHLLKFNERITLAGEHIRDDMLLDYMDKVDNANQGQSITFFEYTTALAFKVFSDIPADVLLLETGLGGRLDCTNVIRNPLATIITSIGYDHMDWLGHEIIQIASEKAGIMKQDCPCFIAPQAYGDQIENVFIEQAEELDCPLYFIDTVDDMPPLGLVGEHQKDNAATAMATISVLFPEIHSADITKGLLQVNWPARMEKISNAPEVWFDCGHNPDGAKTIGQQLRYWKEQSPENLIYLIIGLAGDKDVNEFMAPLWDYCECVICVDLPNARNPQTGDDLKNKIMNPPKAILTAKDFKSALLAIDTSLNHVVLACGSLYLYESVKN